MKCPHCGEELPEGFTYNNPDVEQENTIDETVQNETVSQENTDGKTPETSEIYNSEIIPTSGDFLSTDFTAQPQQSQKIKIIKRITVSALITAIAISGISVGITIYGKSKLQKDLMGKWQTDGDILSSSVIEFKENTVSYSQSMGFMEINSITLPYTVKNSKTIIIDDTKFEITFESENTMIISPGLSGGSAQTWYSVNSQSEQENVDNPGDSDKSGIL